MAPSIWPVDHEHHEDSTGDQALVGEPWEEEDNIGLTLAHIATDAGGKRHGGASTEQRCGRKHACGC